MSLLFSATRLLNFLFFWFFWVSHVSIVSYANVTPFLPLSFLFDWNDPSQSVPIPVTEQCETIHIKWGRNDQTGPNPTAPYFLHVYTSNFIQPFIISAGSGLSFDWAVPFAPNTLYQICMFDVNGFTGGCQDIYTMIPSSIDSNPSCSNVTFTPQLLPKANVTNGPMSQFGFIDQCTDISITPTAGTPPFTLMVAPSLHPPYIITSDDYQPINWTVSLSWASSFFISLADSKGALWSNGPLHAGGPGTTGCLVGPITGPKMVKASAVVGGSLGGLFGGIILGTVVAFIFIRYWIVAHFIPRPGSPEAGMDERAIFGSSLIRKQTTDEERLVNPFVLGRSASATSSEITTPNSPTDRENPSGESGKRAGNANQVYVIHHDSEVSPVTIYHGRGTEIVELPPLYPSFSSIQEEENKEYSPSDQTEVIQARPAAEPAPVLNQPRRPVPVRKGQRLRVH